MSDWLDDFLNDIVDDPKLSPFVSTASQDLRSGYEAPSFWGSGVSAPQEESAASSWADTPAPTDSRNIFDTMRAPSDQVAAYMQQDRKPEQNVFDRILSGAKDGARKAWERDPLEVLKFGANAIGGYYAAERANKKAQETIDAANAKAKLEHDQLAAHNAGISNLRIDGNAYRGPLRRKNGAQVFDSNGKIVGYSK